MIKRKELNELLAKRGDITAKFALRIYQLRTDANMTQLCMASKFGIDRSFISDVERGLKSISLPMMEIIALGFKITLSDLLEGM